MNFNLTKAPLVMAELRLLEASATVPYRIISTHGSGGAWKAARSTTTHIGAWTSGDYGGERVDFSLDEPGWATPSFDASSWEAAAAFPLDREVSAESLEPTGVVGTVPAATIAPCAGNAPGCFLVIMSELFSGWLSLRSLTAAAPSGLITISYSTNNDTVCEVNQLDQVVASSTNTTVSFRNRFAYHEMQYVTITGLAAAPALGDVQGLRLMNMRKRVGAFSSTNPMLNAIYDAMAKTYEGLNLGGYSVDCPHRERLGYGGDAHTSLEFAMATYSSHAFFTKWAQDWRDTQGWDGTDNLPHTSTFDGGGGPAWGGFIVVMPWHVYLTTGDTRILTTNLPTMERFIAFLLSNVNGSSGLLEPFGGSWGFLGDWVTPHGSEESSSPEALLFNNCYLVYIIKLVARINGVLGNAGQEVYYTSLASVLGESITAAFYLSTPPSYLDTRQTHLVLPLLASIVPTNLTAAVLGTLVDEVMQVQHIDTGLHGTYFIAKLLTDPAIGRDDLMYLMATQTTAPGYGDLLAQGYTTWPEEWQGAPSRMHGCLNGFGLWFPQGLLGVRASPEAPGFARITVRPAYGVGGLQGAQGVNWTPFGPVANAWQVIGGTNYTHRITVPGNTQAELWIPARSEGVVTEGGGPAMVAAGVQYLRTEGSLTVWLIGSGTYSFASYV